MEILHIILAFLFWWTFFMLWLMPLIVGSCLVGLFSALFVRDPARAAWTGGSTAALALWVCLSLTMLFVDNTTITVGNRFMLALVFAILASPFYLALAFAIRFFKKAGSEDGNNNYVL